LESVDCRLLMSPVGELGGVYVDTV
jgi:hypothetical protein